jgi:hypothetical protein
LLDGLQVKHCSWLTSHPVPAGYLIVPRAGSERYDLGTGQRVSKLVIHGIEHVEQRFKIVAMRDLAKSGLE